MSPTLPRAYSYIRFSSKPQEQGDSLRRQLSLARAWASRNPGYCLDESTYRDLGIPAFKGANKTKGALGAFIQAVENGAVKKGSVLLVESLDRLSREEVEEALELFLKLVRLGITIVTLGDPETTFRKGQLDMVKLILAIVIMSRAHEESARKSERIGKAWAQKRANIQVKKLTRACPAWLELSADKTKYLPIPEKVATVNRIFRLTIEGVGATSLERMFNSEKVPVLGTKKNSGRWHKSYIEKILNNPAVYGEYQPHTGHVGDRKPIGSPIPDYFPVIISRKDFDRAQAARAGRRIATGPSSKRIANLFTGIVYDGQGSTLVRVDKGDGLAYLVSSAAHRGETKQYTTFPYAVFERAILRYLGELKPEDILPASTARNALRDDLDAVEGRLGGLAKRIEKAVKVLDEGGDIAAGFSLLRKWEGEQKMLETERENLRRELTSAEAIRLGDSQKTLDLLGKAREDDLYRLRQRAKQQIRNLVKAMVVRIEIENGSRVITAKILLSTGVERGIKVRHGRHETTYSVLEDLQNLRTGGRPSRVRFRRDRHQQRIDRDSPSPGRDS